jgi:hypothetical protein
METVQAVWDCGKFKYVQYKGLEKEVKTKIQKSKRKLEKELARGEDKNNRKFGSYIKSKTKSKTGFGPLKNENGEVVSENKVMATILNNFFSTVKPIRT